MRIAPLRKAGLGLLLLPAALLVLSCGESDESPPAPTHQEAAGPPSESPGPSPSEAKPDEAPNEELAGEAPPPGYTQDPCPQPTDDPPVPDAAPDWRLRDANANSRTARKCVSPRDYLGSVSAWYWGHTG